MKSLIFFAIFLSSLDLLQAETPLSQVESSQYNYIRGLRPIQSEVQKRCAPVPDEEYDTCVKNGGHLGASRVDDTVLRTVGAVAEEGAEIDLLMGARTKATWPPSDAEQDCYAANKKFVNGFCVAKYDEGVNYCENDQKLVNESCVDKKETIAKTPEEKKAAKQAINKVKNLSACEAAVEEMNGKCEASNDKGLTGARKMVETMTAGVTAMASNDMNLWCSKAGTAAVTLNGALGAYKGNCAVALENCKRLCDSDLLPDDNTDYQAKCRKGSDTIAGVDSNLTVLTSQIFRAKQCDNYLKQQQASTSCAANPFAPGCQANAGDCSNPANAGNPTCLCIRNPSSQACANLYGKLGAGANTAASVASQTGANGINLKGTGDGSLGLGGPFGGNEDLAKFGPSESGNGKAPGGGGGRSVSANTRDGKGPENNQGGGAAPSSLAGTKVTQGFYGGGGGGFGGSPGGYGNSPSSNGKVATAGQPRIDLKQFLPGGALDPRRHPAGIVGPDGITGPSLDIFHKINYVYSSVGNTLLAY